MTLTLLEFPKPCEIEEWPCHLFEWVDHLKRTITQIIIWIMQSCDIVRRQINNKLRYFKMTCAHVSSISKYGYRSHTPPCDSSTFNFWRIPLYDEECPRLSYSYVNSWRSFLRVSSPGNILFMNRDMDFTRMSHFAALCFN